MSLDSNTDYGWRLCKLGTLAPPILLLISDSIIDGFARLCSLLKHRASGRIAVISTSNYLEHSKEAHTLTNSFSLPLFPPLLCCRLPLKRPLLSVLLLSLLPSLSTQLPSRLLRSRTLYALPTPLLSCKFLPPKYYDLTAVYNFFFAF